MSKKKVVGFQDIMAYKAPPIKEVDLGGLGLAYVRTISADEFDKYQERFEGEDAELSGARAAFAALALCDEEGKRIVKTETEIKALGTRPIWLIEKIVREARAHNGMLGDKEMEELEGN